MQKNIIVTKEQFSCFYKFFKMSIFWRNSGNDIEIKNISKGRVEKINEVLRGFEKDEISW